MKAWSLGIGDTISVETTMAVNMDVYGECTEFTITFNYAITLASDGTTHEGQVDVTYTKQYAMIGDYYSWVYMNDNGEYFASPEQAMSQLGLDGRNVSYSSVVHGGPTTWGYEAGYGGYR